MLSFPAWLPVSVSFVSAAVALAAFSYQVHRARFNQSVDLLFRLENDFFGADKAKQRSLAAQNFLANSADFLEMEDILDFFETIAMLTRKKALDVYMVWHTFDYWIERYYAIARPHILKRQASEPGVWEDLAWLVPKLAQLQSKKSGHTVSTFTEKALAAFLAEESAEG
jgi:uncharacterized membrane protein YidH (DUF202 family)